MSEQHERSPFTSQTSMLRSATDDHAAWLAYWTAQGQPWRTEPEIDSKRQEELAQLQTIARDVERGIYPFKGVMLNRADVEWLLATHENGRGPVDWNDEIQREREGLDLRAADLRGVDLNHLPLARFQGGFVVWGQRADVTDEQHEAGAIHLEGANLRSAHLEGAILEQAHLEGANLARIWAENINLYRAHLEGASLTRANLKHADFGRAHLEGADLRGAVLDEATLSDAHLEGARLSDAFLNRATRLDNICLRSKERGSALLADVHWGDANLTVIRWSQLDILGDEQKAQQKMREGQQKDAATGLEEYETAVRANRQIAVALQSQGLNEEAARFAYHAQTLQRRIFWKQQAFGKWLFSMLLALLAGYGYRPSRSFLAYLLVISGFATVYYLLGRTVGPVLSPLGAFVFSMTSFHGRGFFPGNNISLDDPLTVLAAIEALVGLIIEVTFIATLTQRFFNR